MKNKIILIVFLGVCSVSFGQQTITWQDLAKVKFTEKYFPALKETFLYPHFSVSVKSLEGKQVQLKGYFLDVDPQGKLYVLSKGPMSSCFFCGEGGPETAVEIQLASAANFKTDDVLVVTGTLYLNADDIEHFNYILKDCRAKRIDK
ncbi:hypothetical protein FHR24_003046 [Wenyingzhuangia heitensis]|uniref:DUF3299 domain-containing protein n=1 Tax=Wenyingzhuangia heitensis TaxID=1487859 RepID=A0ABX0UCK5_9FLAO|nr:hypothetical protein [Wenyingzhuangia heitensis]NIJ46557.1 hypothetical protein [Wenyingzhuangia heitensis]